VVDVGLQRGFRNNGLIEIENMPDNYLYGDFNDIEMNGVLYRLPERGIRLDFFERVKWYAPLDIPGCDRHIDHSIVTIWRSKLQM
jgi:hypothetical protein